MESNEKLGLAPVELMPPCFLVLMTQHHDGVVSYIAAFSAGKPVWKAVMMLDSLAGPLHPLFCTVDFRTVGQDGKCQNNQMA